MVIDDVGVHRTAKGAAMNGGSVNSEGLLERPKEKPSKKSKPKSDKKNGKVGAPPNSVSDEHRNTSDHSGRSEPVSATMTPIGEVAFPMSPKVRSEETAWAGAP